MMDEVMNSELSEEIIDDVYDDEPLDENLTDEEKAEDDVDILQNEVISYFGNYSLSEYHSKLGKVFIKPDFQRNEVWSNYLKSKLIESFLASYPVPPVILYKLKGAEKYLIIDGLQRITAIVDYFNDKYRLSIKNEKFKGKKFSKLEEEAREKLKNSFLHCIIVREVLPTNEAFLYSLFERLNTASIKLTPMEVRRAISGGDLITSLEQLNQDIHWRAILGQEKPAKRFSDMELILRLLAFFKNYDPKAKELKNYTGMKTFLDNFVNDNKNVVFEDFNEIFLKATRNIHETLGEQPFVLTPGKLNYIILDSVMNAIIQGGGDIIDLKDRYTTFRESESFLRIYDDKSGTSTSTKINARLNFAYEAFNEESTICSKK